MHRGVKDKMRRGGLDKSPADVEGRDGLAKEKRRKRALEAAYRERYLPPSPANRTPDRTANQIAALPGAWE